MHSTARLGLTLSLCLLPAIVFAQDGFPGQYELTGRYSNRRATQVDLKVIKTPDAGVIVVRTAKFTSRRHRDKPEFTWSSGNVKIEGRRMHVTYEVDVPGSDDRDSLVSRLDPDTATRGAVVSALTKTNTFSAVYFLSQDKNTLREIVVNTTRLGEDRWWLWAASSGDRQRTPAITSLSRADYETIRDKTIEDWYLEDVRETYESLLADADTAEEKRKLREDRAIDMDFSNNEIMEVDYWFEDSIEDRYEYNDDPYLDAHGRPIPKDSLEAVTLSMYPEYAGIGLSKAFLFDTRTGELIDEGDIMD